MKTLFFLIAFSAAAYSQDVTSQIKFLKINFQIESDSTIVCYHIGDAVTKIGQWKYQSKNEIFYLPDESLSDVAINPIVIKNSIVKPPTTPKPNLSMSNPAPKAAPVKAPFVPFDNPLNKKAYNR